MYEVEKVTWFLCLTGAMWYDLVSAKIPNGLVIGGSLCALTGRSIRGGWAFLNGAAGMLSVLIGLYVLFMYRMIGAGDIKLLGMCGAFLGLRDAWMCIIVSFLVGGVISIILLLKRGNTHSRFHYFIQYLRDTGFLRYRKSYLSGVDRGGRFSFSVPILISAVLKIGGVY